MSYEDKELLQDEIQKYDITPQQPVNEQENQKEIEVKVEK